MQEKRINIALPPLRCSDFLTYILDRHRAPTTLVICSSREAFLKDLHSSVANTDDTSHTLLVPTIHLISRSSSVHVAFVPTVSHLRAYLATYRLDSEPAPFESIIADSGYRSPLLALWSPASLHRSTTEYSAQGLNRSMALAVEAAAYGKQRLVLAEPRTMSEGGEFNDADTPDTNSADPWKDQVPLLSGSIRYGGEERTLAGTTIEVRRVVARWCKFVKLD